MHKTIQLCDVEALLLIPSIAVSTNNNGSLKVTADPGHPVLHLNDKINTQHGVYILHRFQTIQYLFLKCIQVPLQALVFALQGLNFVQIVTKIVGVEGSVLLIDPVFGFISIP